MKLKVQGQPVEVLAMLLERPGEVVMRDEIRRRLWPADIYVDFEHSLNSTIRRLRDALGDNADNPLFIETVPRVGYRFIASVNQIENGLRDLGTPVTGVGFSTSVTLNDPQIGASNRTAGFSPSVTPTSLRKGVLWLASLALLTTISGIAARWFFLPGGQPRVTNISQLTNDGLPKIFATDGSRIYYAAITRESTRFYQVSAEGGEPVRMRELDGMLPLDFSPGRSELLLERKKDHSLWAASAVGSTPRPLNGLIATEAKWSPSGTEIAYPAQKQVRIARSDGSEARTLATADGPTYGITWYPDGSKLIFSVWTEDTTSLWEVSANGTGLHRLFPHWTDYSEWYGSWTPDRKYLIFVAMDNARSYRWDIWTLRERSDLFSRSSEVPVRLTTGPLRINDPEISPNGKRIFFYGILDRTELVRYDPITKLWSPYLAGLSAQQLDFTKDAKSLTYSSYPEHELFRSESDGSNKLRLTEPPLQGVYGNPRFSPDGTLIAFVGVRPSEPASLYVEASDGSSLRKLTNGECGRDGESDPGWSPDGAFLVFGCAPVGPKAGLNRDNTLLRIIDLKGGQISMLPGSQGLWSPRWSPNGRYLLALSFPLPASLILYDVQTHAQKQLFAPKNGNWPAWSRDSQFAYVQDGSTEYRVRIKNGHAEPVADLTNLEDPSWVGITPDGSVIATRNRGSSEIYALDWAAP